MQKLRKKKIFRIIELLMIGSMTSTLANAMQVLTEDEMSQAQGQALLSLVYTAPPTGKTGTGTTTSDYAFYKLGMQAKIELNANIRSLQLGCGGINGPNACDIEMENVSLSGLPDGKTVDLNNQFNNGVPTWSKGRANTSAQLTNPFVEFAIKNPGNAATREIVGFRTSAEEILGHLSAGTSNTASPTDGIKSFSGYIEVGSIPASAFTAPAVFGTKIDQAIYGQITALANLTKRNVSTYVAGMDPNNASHFDDVAQDNANFYSPTGTNNNRIWGIHVPSQTVAFTFPQTIVTGSRMSQLNLVVRDVPIPTIAIGSDSGAVRLIMDESVLGLAQDAIFFMGANSTAGKMASCNANYTANSTNCTYVVGLKANVDVKQNFNLVHNLPLTTGGYLSLQNTDLKWPGSKPNDTAKPGWWMSFSDPLDLGALNPTTGIPMDDVLPQMAQFITKSLSQTTISLGLGDAFNAILGAPVYKALGDIAIPSDARAVMVLENLLLDGHQKPVSNCWGNLKMC